MPEDLSFDHLDDEIDSLLDEWAAVDGEAATVLADAWPDTLSDREPPATIKQIAEQIRSGVDAGQWPFDYFAPDFATGLPPHLDASEVWLDCAASTISPFDDPAEGRGLDIEDAAVLSSAMHADWLVMVLGLVRRGVGAELSAELALVDLDEITDDLEDVGDTQTHLGHLIEVIAPRWQALGALDEDRRLTELGSWGLPRVLHLIWHQPEDGPGLRVEPLDPETEQAALDILARGPIAPRDLRRTLAAEEMVVDAERLHSSMIAHEEIFEFDDGRWGHRPTLCEGVVMTHRLTGEEIAAGTLAVGVDLDPWVFSADPSAELIGVGQIRTVLSGHEQVPGGDTFGLAGLDAWLAGFEPGEVIGLRYVAGRFQLERFAEEDLQSPAAREDEARLLAAARVAAAYVEETRGPEDLGVLGSEVVHRVRAEQPGSLTTPRRPLGEVLAEGDLSIHGGLVGLPGTEWEPAPDWLSAPQQELWRQWCAAVRGESGIDLAGLARSAEPDLVGAFASHVQHQSAAGEVAAAMLSAAEGPSVGVPHFLLAAAAEASGDLPTRISHLEQALAADPTLDLALLDLADIRSLQGDARGALELYRAAGFEPDAAEIALLRPFLHPPEGGPGRNKPCPCGSGKKYKVCHGRTDQHPLPDRAGWLWAKVELYLQRPLRRVDLMGWAAALAPEDAASETVDRDAMSNSTVLELLAFDGGGIEAFLADLGEVIPGDERGLLEVWQESPRRLLEVTEVVPMRGLFATDLVTSEELEIRDRRMSIGVAPRDVILGRPLDDGDGVLRFRCVPLAIPRLMRSRFLAVMRRGGEVNEVLELLTPRSAPEVRTSDGDELLLCTARYDCADLDAAWSALVAAEDSVQDGDATVHVLDPNGTVVGTFRRDSRLVLETMSLERLRRLQETLASTVPDARLVDESTEPLSVPDQGPEESTQSAPDLDPEVMAEVFNVLRQRWYDDPVPALGGLTPREAAADPEALGELEALLEDYAWQNRRGPGPHPMDVAELRRGLGLG